MLILISPAKTMNEKRIHEPKRCPVFCKEASCIREHVITQSTDELSSLMKINMRIAQAAAKRFADMKFDMEGIAALDAYDGIQFKAMELSAMQDQERAYLCSYLRILSGFYGLVHPDDSIYPYRLEMQTPLLIAPYKNLYKFWQDKIAKELLKELSTHKSPYLLNLASKEYAKAVYPFVPKDCWIDVTFYVKEQDKLLSRSTQVKKARGAMVRYMAQHKITNLEKLKDFDMDGYRYDEARSLYHSLVFVKGSL